MKQIMAILLVFSLFFFFSHSILNSQDIMDKVSFGFVDNNGVKIHYATIGQGPLIVMLHGFPDFWYTWRNQMEVLAKDYQVVAIDLRGYNKSDKPKGEENYTMKNLISDVAAVINHFPQNNAVVIGHDWGGAIAWQTAIWKPELVNKLIVLSTPHPNGLLRELKNNSDQQKNSQYANDFQKEGAEKSLNAQDLAEWVKDEKAKRYYIDAFNNSDFEAMLNYYKASYPKNNSNNPTSNNKSKKSGKIKCPVLGIFGLEDKALLPSGWNGTWDWIDNNLTLVSIPGAGHFVQHDASDEVSNSILSWLNKNSLLSRNNFQIIADKIKPFDKLLGEWEIDSQYIRSKDGSWISNKKKFKWKFYTILGGEAIQDDWFSIDSTGNENISGTNIRIFNEDENEWQMAWLDITFRKTAVFTAKNIKGEVFMDGINSQGRHVKNTFFNITEKYFDWKQEWTFDDGKSWVEVVKMKGTRN